MTATYKYPRPALTVDVAAFGLHEKDLRILLVQRGHATGIRKNLAERYGRRYYKYDVRNWRQPEVRSSAFKRPDERRAGK